mmetsp:Transcript_49483/g.112325  ORF Transcript_49483/g.112325 Transcript_49483/m.112325 type:complete len:83 (-) Transcript_49483:846-1094(-)
MCYTDVPLGPLDLPGDLPSDFLFGDFDLVVELTFDLVSSSSAVVRFDFVFFLTLSGPIVEDASSSSFGFFFKIDLVFFFFLR